MISLPIIYFLMNTLIKNGDIILLQNIILQVLIKIMQIISFSINMIFKSETAYYKENFKRHCLLRLYLFLMNGKEMGLQYNGIQYPAAERK